MEEGLKRLFSKQPRDPRFLPLAGAFSADKFRKSYGFLAETHKTELTTLRESLKQARKLLASSPKDLYAEREAEVRRLELAVKRAESQVNKDRQDRIEQEAVEKLAGEERKKRKEGKEEWHLKKCKCWESLTARDAYWTLQRVNESCLCGLGTKRLLRKEGNGRSRKRLRRGRRRLVRRKRNRDPIPREEEP